MPLFSSLMLGNETDPTAVPLVTAEVARATAAEASLQQQIDVLDPSRPVGTFDPATFVDSTDLPAAERNDYLRATANGTIELDGTEYEVSIGDRIRCEADGTVANSTGDWIFIDMSAESDSVPEVDCVYDFSQDTVGQTPSGVTIGTGDFLVQADGTIQPVLDAANVALITLTKLPLRPEVDFEFDFRSTGGRLQIGIGQETSALDGFGRPNDRLEFQLIQGGNLFRSYAGTFYQAPPNAANFSDGITRRFRIRVTRDGTDVRTLIEWDDNGTPQLVFDESVPEVDYPDNWIFTITGGGGINNTNAFVSNIRGCVVEESDDIYLVSLTDKCLSSNPTLDPGTDTSNENISNFRYTAAVAGTANSFFIRVNNTGTTPATRNIATSGLRVETIVATFPPGDNVVELPLASPLDFAIGDVLNFAPSQQNPFPLDWQISDGPSQMSLTIGATEAIKGHADYEMFGTSIIKRYEYSDGNVKHFSDGVELVGVDDAALLPCPEPEALTTPIWIKEGFYSNPSTDPFDVGNAANFLDEITAAQLATLPAGPHFRWTAPENVTLTTLTVARLNAATNTEFSWTTSTGESGSTSTAGAGTINLDLGSIVLAQGDTIDFTIDAIPGGQMQLATPALATADGWTALQDFSGFATTSFLTNNLSGFSGGGDDLIIRTNKTGPPQIIDRDANTCTDTTQAFVDTLTLKPDSNPDAGFLGIINSESELQALSPVEGSTMRVGTEFLIGGGITFPAARYYFRNGGWLVDLVTGDSAAIAGTVSADARLAGLANNQVFHFHSIGAVSLTTANSFGTLIDGEANGGIASPLNIPVGVQGWMTRNANGDVNVFYTTNVSVSDASKAENYAITDGELTTPSVCEINEYINNISTDHLALAYENGGHRTTVRVNGQNAVYQNLQNAVDEGDGTVFLSGGGGNQVFDKRATTTATVTKPGESFSIDVGNVGGFSTLIASPVENPQQNSSTFDGRQFVFNGTSLVIRNGTNQVVATIPGEVATWDIVRILAGWEVFKDGVSVYKDVVTEAIDYRNDPRFVDITSVNGVMVEPIPDWTGSFPVTGDVAGSVLSLGVDLTTMDHLVIHFERSDGTWPAPVKLYPNEVNFGIEAGYMMVHFDNDFLSVRNATVAEFQAGDLRLFASGFAWTIDRVEFRQVLPTISSINADNVTNWPGSAGESLSANGDDTFTFVDSQAEAGNAIVPPWSANTAIKANELRRVTLLGASVIVRNDGGDRTTAATFDASSEINQWNYVAQSTIGSYADASPVIIGVIFREAGRDENWVWTANQLETTNFDADLTAPFFEVRSWQTQYEPPVINVNDGEEHQTGRMVNGSAEWEAVYAYNLINHTSSTALPVPALTNFAGTIDSFHAMDLTTFDSAGNPYLTQHEDMELRDFVINKATGAAVHTYDGNWDTFTARVTVRYTKA